MGSEMCIRDRTRKGLGRHAQDGDPGPSCAGGQRAAGQWAAHAQIRAPEERRSPKGFRPSDSLNARDGIGEKETSAGDPDFAKKWTTDYTDVTDGIVEDVKTPFIRGIRAIRGLLRRVRGPPPENDAGVSNRNGD